MVEGATAWATKYFEGETSFYRLVPLCVMVSAVLVPWGLRRQQETALGLAKKVYRLMSGPTTITPPPGLVAGQIVPGQVVASPVLKRRQPSAMTH